MLFPASLTISIITTEAVYIVHPLGSTPGYLCTYKYIDVQNIIDRYKMAKYPQTLLEK